VFNNSGPATVAPSSGTPRMVSSQRRTPPPVSACARTADKNSTHFGIDEVLTPDRAPGVCFYRNIDQPGFWSSCAASRWSPRQQCFFPHSSSLIQPRGRGRSRFVCPSTVRKTWNRRRVNQIYTQSTVGSRSGLEPEVEWKVTTTANTTWCDLAGTRSGRFTPPPHTHTRTHKGTHRKRAKRLDVDRSFGEGERHGHVRLRPLCECRGEEGGEGGRVRRGGRGRRKLQVFK
jgi:hypothetical protein